MGDAAGEADGLGDAAMATAAQTSTATAAPTSANLFMGLLSCALWIGWRSAGRTSGEAHGAILRPTELTSCESWP